MIEGERTSRRLPYKEEWDLGAAKRLNVPAALRPRIDATSALLFKKSSVRGRIFLSTDRRDVHQIRGKYAHAHGGTPHLQRTDT
jgi:hypothetical protein